MKKKLLVGLAAAAVAVIPASSAFADSHEDAQVVVVHGVPDLGTEVDVWVDGEVAFTFDYEDIVVTDLPAGTYDLAVSATGDDEPILELEGAEVAAGGSYTIAAHLDADGNPGLNAYANETDAPGIQPFHLAAFGPVSIIAGGEIVLDDVANGATARIDVTGEVPGVGIGVAGSDEAAIDLGDVTVGDDELVLAYAVGPQEGNDLPDVLVEVVSATPADDNGDDNGEDAEEMEAPDEEHSPGEAGLASTALPVWVIALMALGALSLTVPAVARKRSDR